MTPAGLSWCASAQAIVRHERPAHRLGRSRRGAGWTAACHRSSRCSKRRARPPARRASFDAGRTARPVLPVRTKGAQAVTSGLLLEVRGLDSRRGPLLPIIGSLSIVNPTYRRLSRSLTIRIAITPTTNPERSAWDATRPQATVTAATPSGSAGRADPRARTIWNTAIPR
jgi:hypothetical protein